MSYTDYSKPLLLAHVVAIIAAGVYDEIGLLHMMNAIMILATIGMLVGVWVVGLGYLNAEQLALLSAKDTAHATISRTVYVAISSGLSAIFIWTEGDVAFIATIAVAVTYVYSVKALLSSVRVTQSQ